MLEIYELVKHHGPNRVLAGISMKLEKGRAAVLIGPSGAGKSTVLRCINGLEEFQGGRISIDAELHLTGDQGLAERNRVLYAIRRRVGMVFQQFNLFPHRSVIENVMEAPMVVQGLKREEARVLASSILQRVGLAAKLESRTSQLSGGQQQRVAIARSLAMKPELVLFDEPTSALDPQMTKEVLAVMADLARDGQTMLVVTHAMEFARRAAQEIHVLSAGTIVESGSPDQILDAPNHPATKELLSHEIVT